MFVLFCLFCLVVCLFVCVEGKIGVEEGEEEERETRGEYMHVGKGGKGGAGRVWCGGLCVWNRSSHQSLGVHNVAWCGVVFDCWMDGWRERERKGGSTYMYVGEV